MHCTTNIKGPEEVCAVLSEILSTWLHKRQPDDIPDKGSLLAKRCQVNLTERFCHGVVGCPDACEQVANAVFGCCGFLSRRL